MLCMNKNISVYIRVLYIAYTNRLVASNTDQSDTYALNDYSNLFSVTPPEHFYL